MKCSKYIFRILGFLLVFFYTSSNMAIYAGTEQKVPLEHTVSNESHSQLLSTSFSELKGILQPTNRIVESNSPASQLSKTSNKMLSLNFVLNSSVSSKILLPYFFKRGLHNFTSYPLYIAFRRLLI